MWSDFSSCVFCFNCCRRIVVKSAFKRLFPDAFNVGYVSKLAFLREMRLLPFFLRPERGLYFSFQAPKGGRSRWSFIQILEAVALVKKQELSIPVPPQPSGLYTLRLWDCLAQQVEVTHLGGNLSS